MMNEDSLSRRQFLATGIAAGAASVAGCTLGTSTESSRTEGPEIGLEAEVSGLTFPTGMAFLPNGDSLLIERTGQVLRQTGDGLADGVFLDVSDQMSEVADEKGLIGLAIHPDFSDNRRFYLRYSGALPESLSDEGLSHIAVLSEFQATEDLGGVVPDSQRRILEVPEPGSVHNAGAITFGPDGYLYVALGDGQRTSFGDEGTSWWHDQGQAAQNTTDNLLGGILRIDVDERAGERAYGVPPDNPLVGETGRDEYYAWGLRNPYRMSFDGEDLYVADVGEHIRESVYIIEKGANHGWPIVEGSSCAPSTSIGHAVADNPLNVFNPKTWQSLTNRISPVKVCPGDTDGGLNDPIIEYNRSGSRAVTGGYVYRGEDVPALQGQYVFGDFAAPSPIFATERPDNGGKPWPMSELVVSGTESGRLSEALLALARDPQGEIYVLTSAFTQGSGRVRRIVAAE
jgi:glucose/arabinose dehydrogenase